MSKTIDQRVVEMRFDNSQFESNVQKSMSTLEKLKQSLKLPNSSKSLENISAAAKKVDFSGMTKGIETVNARFSNMQVIGMTALSNITTAAMNAGTNLVKSFTIQPITDGFREYELQMNSVQTILANTASKGTTIEDVTAALDELNEYADQTIYNFGEMTKNIGTFTAAGVDLDKATSAIKGIANLGAMSGSTSMQVSTAMYQLSQALAAGRVSLMDWNSVVNAGMGGEQFQNALKRTAEHFGTDVDAMIKKYGSFRESLTRGQWLTAEVLTETLNQISGAYTEADLITQGYTQDQAKAIVEMANTATDAATKVKTFTQLMSTLNEAAGSGWAKTWQLLLGDFEEAKEFFTELSEYLGGMIGASADARNELIGGAMNSNWVKLTDQIEEAGVPLETFTEKLKEVAKETKNLDLDAKIEEFGSLEEAMKNIPGAADLITETIKRLAGSGTEMNKSTEAMTQKLEHFQKVVDEVWLGSYANGEERVKKLTEAGYDYAEVQDLVNKVENGRKLTLEDLNETQMKAIGFTDEQIKALQDLAREAETSGSSLNELINNLNKPSGRVLLLETIMNSIKAILEPLRAIGTAFSNVFGIDTDQLYSVVEALHRFSEAIVMDPESLEKITRTFQGLFGILKIFTSFIGGGFGIAFNLLTGVLENFNLGILDVTAFIGDLLYGFSEFITSGEVVKGVIDGLIGLFEMLVSPLSNVTDKLAEVPGIKDALDAVKGFFDSLFGYFSSLTELDPSEALGKIIEDVKNAFSNFTWEGFISGLSNFGETVRNAFSGAIETAKTIGPDIIAGLQNGLSGSINGIIEKMKEIGIKIIEAIKAVLGIQSPSTEMIEVGKNIIEGLIEGVKSILSTLWDVLQGIWEGIKGFFSGIDWGSVIMIGMGAGILVSFYKISKAIETLASPFEGLGDVFESASKVLDTFAGTLKSFSLNIKAQALKNIAIAIAILVGSIAVLTFLDQGKVIASIVMIGVLAGILVALSAALGKFSVGGFVDAAKISGMMLAIGTSLLMFAGVMAIVSTMEWEDLKKAGAALGSFAVIVLLIIGITKIGNDSDLEKASKMIRKIGTAFLLLAIVAKLISTMSWSDMGKAGAGLAGLTAIVAGLMLLTRFGGKQIAQSGYIIQKIAASMLILAVAAKVIATMSWEDLGKAGVGLAGLTGIVALLVLITKLGGKNIDEIGSTLLKIAAAIGILALTAKLISGMSFEEMGRAAIGLSGLVGIVAILVLITNLAPTGEIAKMAGTLLAMSVSIGILAGIAVLLGMVRTENLIKGIVAVGALATLVAGLVAVTKFAQDVKGTMIGIAISIGVMAAALAVLSFIDPKNLASATIAFTIVMGMFALIVKQTEVVGKAMGTLIVLTIAIGMIGGVIYLLSGIPVEQSIGTAISLSVLLLALTGACKVLDGIGKISASAIVAMGVLTLVVAGLGAVLGLLSYFNLEASMSSVVSISTMLLAMSGACFILSNIKSVSTGALAAIAVLTLVVGGIGLVLGLLSYFDIAPSLETTLSLSVLLLAMSAAVGILGLIGPVAQAAVPAAIAMAEVLGIIALVVAAAGAIKQIPGVDWLVSEGGSFLQSIGEAIGQFVGGIVGGTLEGISSSFPEIATNLSSFMENIQPFIDGAQKITPESMAGIKSLAEAILIITTSDLLNSITSFITGGNSMEDFANQLVPLGEAMMGYSNAVSGIDSEAVVASAKAAEGLSQLASNLPKEGGLAQAVFGESTDLGTFGDQLVTFGVAIKKYSETVTGMDTAAITASAEAGTALSKLANELPKEGGLAQAVFGETQDLGDFGTKLVEFGQGIKTYSETVTGLDTQSILSSAEAGTALSKLATSLPKEGGLAAAIFGDETDMGTFGEQIKSFGEALKAYAASVTGLDVESITKSVDAGWALNDLANALPDEDGWVENFFGGGQTDLSEFGKNLSSFGGALQSYSSSVSGIDFGQVSIATDSVEEIIDLIKRNTDADLSGIDKIKQINEVGESIKQYSDKVSGLNADSITTSITSIDKLVKLINSMAGLDTSGIGSFKSAVSSLAETNLRDVATSFSDASSRFATVGTDLVNAITQGIKSSTGSSTKAVEELISKAILALKSKESSFRDYGVKFVEKMIDGVESRKSSFVSSFKSALTGAADSIRSYYTSFYNAGTYLCQGLANGITAGSYTVQAKAYAMASAAATSARNALQIKSPSRVFYEIGDYAGQGFVNALGDYVSVSKNAGYDMADSARIGLNSAMSKIDNLLNSDLDMSPTIRPVLDLSDVENNVGNLNNLLNTSSTVDLLGNANFISRRMNQRNQNGTSFGDVVKAIDKLRGDVSNISRPSYIIEGITYDDGTAISTAIGDLVRATRIEGRV